MRVWHEKSLMGWRASCAREKERVANVLASGRHGVLYPRPALLGREKQKDKTCQEEPGDSVCA